METRQKQTLRNMSHGERAAFFGAFLGWIFDYYEIFLLTFLVVPISQELQLTLRRVRHCSLLTLLP